MSHRTRQFITGADAARNWRRGRDSNPRTPFRMLLTFQASAFDHSATSPRETGTSARGRKGTRGRRGDQILRPQALPSPGCSRPCWAAPVCSAAAHPCTDRAFREAVAPPRRLESRAPRWYSGYRGRRAPGAVASGPLADIPAAYGSPAQIRAGGARSRWRGRPTRSPQRDDGFSRCTVLELHARRTHRAQHGLVQRLRQFDQRRTDCVPDEAHLRHGPLHGNGIRLDE